MGVLERTCPGKSEKNGASLAKKARVCKPQNIAILDLWSEMFSGKYCLTGLIKLRYLTGEVP